MWLCVSKTDIRDPRFRLNVSTLILGCRSIEKGQAARKVVLAQAPFEGKTDIQVWQVDLENYKSVMAFNDRVRTTLTRLDGFIANAGIETKHFGVAEGLEKTLTINVVSTYLMALGVLSKLKETALRFNTQPVLSIVGSMIHVFGPEEQFRPSADQANKSDIFATLSDRNAADMGRRYPLSKLMVHLCYRELARRVEIADTGGKGSSCVVVNLVNPGWCKTELHRYNGEPLMERFMALIFQRSGEAGGRTLVHAGTAGRETHGKYLSECVEKPQSAYMRSARATTDQAVLWDQLMSKLEEIQPGISAGFT
jgi:retinol dehydrogenase 12